MLKRLYLAITGFVVAGGLLAVPLASANNMNNGSNANANNNVSIGGPSDCDDNAIVHCGVHSAGAIASAYNGSAYVRAVYNSFGISSADINNLSGTVVSGTVTKQNEVFVNGKMVARNAITGGRKNISGSTKVNVNGAVFYRRPPSVSFVSNSLPAFVVMQNGRFQFAIIASCGNAVIAVPVSSPHKVPPPAPTKPKPSKPAAPAQTQTQVQAQQQSQSVTVETAGETTTPPPVTPPAQTPPPAATSSAPATAPASTSLPNTGPGEVFGLFALSSLAGFFGYRRFLFRKLG